jgi:hypothetical protein
VAVDRSHEARNAAESARLARIAERSAAELSRDLGDGWTVATALAHVAFWDRFAHERLKRWLADRSVVLTSMPLVHALNDALLHHWRLLPPKASALEALAAAEAMDGEISRMSDDTIEAYLATLSPGQHPLFLDRTPHRKEHSDQVEAVLG